MVPSCSKWTTQKLTYTCQQCSNISQRSNNYTSKKQHQIRKELVKCWECNSPHYASTFPNQKKTVSNIHTIQEEMSVGDLVRTMPRINASLENRQANYQTSMVEVEGKINQIPISILIDTIASLSYISNLVEKRKLSVEKFARSWLVQLGTGAKRK